MKGIEDVDAGVGEGFAELLLKDFFDAADHEVDNRLRGVNDAVGVSLLDVEALEELLVDGVEEVLFFGVALLGLGGALDGGVEAVEGLEELVAEKWREVMERMTFSISTAMTLRCKNS